MKVSKMRCGNRPSCRILTKEGNSVSHQTGQLTEDTEARQEQDQDSDEK